MNATIPIRSRSRSPTAGGRRRVSRSRSASRGRSKSPSKSKDMVRKTPKPSLSFSRKNMKSIAKSFSFSLSKTKRSVTPMRRSTSTSSTKSSDSQSSSSTELESAELKTPRVRFNNSSNPESKKVKTEIISFQVTTDQEAPHYWYDECDMADMMEEAKHTVKQYLRKCERYRLAMDKIADKCNQADKSRDAITDLLDPKILMQMADAAARGLEHHVCPRTCDSRQDVALVVLGIQDGTGSEENAAAIAVKYAELSKTAKLIAKTMGDGDALVADKILERQGANRGRCKSPVKRTVSAPFERSVSPKRPVSLSSSLTDGSGSDLHHRCTNCVEA